MIAGEARALAPAGAAARGSIVVPIVLAAVGVVLAGIYAAHGVLTGISTAVAVLLAIQGVVYIVSGTVVWLRRPEYITGKLLVLIGFLAMVNGLLRFDQVGVLWAIGAGYSGLYEAVLAYVILTTRPAARRGRSGVPSPSAW